MNITSNKNLFISVEGIEGAGKSTAMQFIQQLLQQKGVNVVVTREPGGTPLAEKLRDLILSNDEETIAADTELLLFFACRAQHIATVIQPALRAGKWVLSDRFVDASIAYQGGGRGIDIARIEALSNWVVGDLVPDLTLLLDLPAELGLSRIGQRGNKDRIELEQCAFFERVRKTYLNLAHKHSQRFRIIDAAQDLPAVQAQLQAVLQAL